MKTKKLQGLSEGVYPGKLYTLELWRADSQYSTDEVHVLRAVYYLNTENGEKNINEILNLSVQYEDDGEPVIAVGERSLLYKRICAWMGSAVDIDDLNFIITPEMLDSAPHLKNFRDKEAEALDVTLDYRGRTVPQAACQVLIGMNKRNYPRVQDVVALKTKKG